jgi:hypothetical protein
MGNSGTKMRLERITGEQERKGNSGTKMRLERITGAQ